MISVPIYSDENGIPQISIYVEDEDGTFRRTQSEPLRLLRDDIQGISICQGDLVSAAYDRYDREWNTPTITFHYGRPQSFYQFLRQKVRRNHFFVFTKPQLAGHISKLSLHELQLKNSTSQRKVAILKEKYTEALRLWSEEELEKRSSPVPVPRPDLESSKHAQGGQDSGKVTYFHHAQASQNKAQDIQQNNLLPEPLQDPQLDPQKNGRKISPMADTAATHVPINKRKNRIQDFSLNKPKQRNVTKDKVQNTHFYQRFIFTID